MINSINNDLSGIFTGSRTKEYEKPEAVLPEKALENKDTISLGASPPETSTYSITGKSDIPNINFTSLRDLIVNLLEEQGLITRISLEDSSVNFRDLTPEKAGELIAEEGYFGVEQTSDRIVQFAISLSGNNPDNLGEIRRGIEEGFMQAKDALGGQLPDISMKTYNSVIEKLDAWAEGIQV